MANVGTDGWFQATFSRRIVRRGLLFASVVGGILVTINHGDAIIRGGWDLMRLVRIVRIVLTVATPDVVSTISSVNAMRDRATD